MLKRLCIRLLLTCVMVGSAAVADEGADVVRTPYSAQKVVFDFFFNEPAHAGIALFWLRSLMNPLMASPYDYAPEELDIKVVIHGTELVTLAKKNYEKYHDIVERMRYYAELGVEFRVCGLALQDFGYSPADLHEFVQVVPSGITELAHWQLQGYALIAPTVLEKKYSNEEIR